MDFLPEIIDRYVSEHTESESDLLSRLNRETWQKVLVPRMLSGHLQGRVLSMFSHMIQPKYILEIGTYTGYSALCLAEGMQEDGELHTIDINEELEPMQRRYFDESGMGDRLHLHVGNALNIVPKLDRPWDLVFIDADKENYGNYYDLLIDQLPSGSFILVDNVLWSGKVVEQTDPGDLETESLKALNEKVQQDERVQNVLFPVRDGLMVLRVI
jgi:predicted O-methyltransferase YrrM